MTKAQLIEFGVNPEKIEEVNTISNKNTILKTYTFDTSLIERINMSNGIFFMKQDDPPKINETQIYLIRYAFKDQIVF